MRTRFLLTLLVLLCGATSAMAQNSLIATLSHDGQVKAFYGGTALGAAHGAAVDGDVITLSSGTFSACNITKAVTIRGAGMVANPATGTFPTYISGNFNIKLSSTTQRLTMEGVNCTGAMSYSTVEKPLFQKCIFYVIEGSSLGNLKNATFINCHITKRLDLYSSSCSATLINCFVTDLYCYDEAIRVDAQNCVIRNKSYNFSLFWNSSFANCIFVGSTTSVGTINANNAVYNCVYTGSTAHIFANIPPGNNKIVANVADIFKEFTGDNYSYDRSFELTETAAKTYLGTDGTQVGMYGGSLPFDPTTSSLQITKCNVAGKSTADGKLSIDIEVSGIK